MNKKNLIVAFAFGLTQMVQAQNTHPIEGKWVYEVNLNTMYLFEDGIRYTYYCVESNCDSLYQTYEAGDGNHIPGTNPYVFKNDTLTVDLNFGNELVTPVIFECDGDKANFVTPAYSMLKVGTDCNATGIDSQEIVCDDRALVKVVNLLGKEITSTKLTNKALFYIYDDGTIEKKMILEQ